MKQLEHNGKTYQIPEDVWEMSLGQWIDTMEVLQTGDNTEDLTTQIKLVSIVSGLSLDEVESLDYNAFVELASLCTLKDMTLPQVVTADEAGLKESREPIRFSVVDEHGVEQTFNFQPDYPMTKMKFIARVEDMLKGRDLMLHLHIVLALTAWKDAEVFDGDIAVLDRKAALMCRAKMSEVYRPLFFFALQGRSSSLFTRIFSREGKAKASVLTAS